METQHERKSGRFSNTQPCSGKVDHTEFVVANEDPGLAVGQGDDALSETLHLILFDIFACAKIEMIMQEEVFVADRCCMTPNHISQTYRWAHVDPEVQVGIVSRALDEGHHWIDFGEKDPFTTDHQ